VTEVGALSADAVAGCGLCMVDTRYGGKWAWLAGRGRCTASRPEWQAERNGSVWGVLVTLHYIRFFRWPKKQLRDPSWREKKTTRQCPDMIAQLMLLIL